MNIHFEADREVRQLAPDHDPADYDDEELIAEVSELYSQANQIKHQIQDDRENGNERGVDWRLRAQGARRHILRRVDVLRVEASSRGMPELVPEHAEMDRIKAARTAHHEAMAVLKRTKAEKRETASIEAHDIAEQRRHEKAMAHERLMLAAVGLKSQRASLFLEAAMRAMSKDDREKIWAKAREMNPDSPVWEPTPGLKSSQPSPQTAETGLGGRLDG